MSCGIEPDEEGSAGCEPYRKGLRHHLCVRCGHGRSDTLKLGWVEELPRWQESLCWIGHPNYYQEHPPPRLEDDDCRRYHLELHMCVVV